jgi:hypothetical protein
MPKLMFRRGVSLVVMLLIAFAGIWLIRKNLQHNIGSTIP